MMRGAAATGLLATLLSSPDARSRSGTPRRAVTPALIGHDEGPHVECLPGMLDDQGGAQHGSTKCSPG